MSRDESVKVADIDEEIVLLNTSLGLDPRREFIQIGTPTIKQLRSFPDTIVNIRYNYVESSVWKKVYGNFRYTNGGYPWHQWDGEPVGFKLRNRLLGYVKKAIERGLLLSAFYKSERGERDDLLRVWNKLSKR